ncbi:P-type ATPase [Nonomuraea aurantiaca]|uniref:P-type ATPase n=1 Tax=Nonomuraea aurantiaca TaxID=2878562 RepID=UPI001CD92D5B|nr:hypothetical protein [Nonomuraea aurantiaca]MCA2229268.1 hypothetical protein [Nonomuraea aurantiaca]
MRQIPGSVEVAGLVPGDVVELRLGEILPADLRLISVTDLECEESALTGESLPTAKATEPTGANTALAELTCGALMGVVREGSGTGVVVATGAAPRSERSRSRLVSVTRDRVPDRAAPLLHAAGARRRRAHQHDLHHQRGLAAAGRRRAAVLPGDRRGHLPQLLPAVVSTSLAASSRRLARHKVLVMRLVCIESLGDVEVLFTDTTGTLTEGRISFMCGVDAAGHVGEEPLELGLLRDEAIVDPDAGRGQVVGGNPLDLALWNSPAAATLHEQLGRYRRLALVPFASSSSASAGSTATLPRSRATANRLTLTASTAEPAASPSQAPPCRAKPRRRPPGNSQPTAAP